MELDELNIDELKILSLKRIAEYIDYIGRNNNIDDVLIDEDFLIECFNNPGIGMKLRIKKILLEIGEEILKKEIPWAYFMHINENSNEAALYLINLGISYLSEISDSEEWNYYKLLINKSNHYSV